MAKDQDWRKTLDVASVGLEMGFSIAIGYLVGSYLDNHLGTGPYMVILFGVAGVGAAFKALWRTAKKYWPEDDEK